MTTTIIFAVALFLVELIFLWGKIKTNENTIQREGENYRVPLLSYGPWWVRIFHKTWFALHFPALIATTPIAIAFHAAGRNDGVAIPTEVIHLINFIIYLGLYLWLYLGGL
jgi:hypothetical protein